MAEVIKISEDTYRIEDVFVRCFLLLGEKEALLVDSGASIPNMKEIASELTKLPMKHILTHSDGDHAAGTGAFEEFYMHPDEEEHFKELGLTNKFIPVNDGDIIDLGNRKLTVIHLPGHTPGSIALLDEKNRVLISGDVIQDDHIVAFGPARNPKDYAMSFHKLGKFKGQFDQVYPSHGTFPLKPELIDVLTEGMDLVFHRRDLLGAPEEIEMWGMKAHSYRLGNIDYQIDRE